DRHAYPQPISTFQKALVRPYLTDSGGTALTAQTGVAWPSALGVQIDEVALEGWRLRPGDESRLRIRAHYVASERGPERVIEGPRMVARLVDAGGVSVWHWDGALVDVGGLEFRAGLTLPPDAADGTYRLQLIEYRAERGADGALRVSQISDPIEAGAVEVITS
ncbi:MAG: hypothetical protein HW416_2214, partial [Chloroflexi bacterium]|nr:hypothetical protein [Chloroflexota bacterium]